MSKFGDFADFCRDSDLVVCNIFPTRNPPSCTLEGFTATNGHRIRNLGIGFWFMWLMNRRYTAVWDCTWSGIIFILCD